jgi:hypothetical protein
MAAKSQTNSLISRPWIFYPRLPGQCYKNCSWHMGRIQILGEYGMDVKPDAQGVLQPTDKKDMGQCPPPGTGVWLHYVSLSGSGPLCRGHVTIR